VATLWKVLILSKEAVADDKTSRFVDAAQKPLLNHFFFKEPCTLHAGHPVLKWTVVVKLKVAVWYLLLEWLFGTPVWVSTGHRIPYGPITQYPSNHLFRSIWVVIRDVLAEPYARRCIRIKAGRRWVRFIVFDNARQNIPLLGIYIWLSFLLKFRLLRLPPIEGVAIVAQDGCT